MRFLYFVQLMGALHLGLSGSPNKKQRSGTDGATGETAIVLSSAQSDPLPAVAGAAESEAEIVQQGSMDDDRSDAAPVEHDEYKDYVDVGVYDGLGGAGGPALPALTDPQALAAALESVESGRFAHYFDDETLLALGDRESMIRPGSRKRSTLGPVNDSAPTFGRGRRGFVSTVETTAVNGALHFLVRSRQLRELMASFVPVVPEAGSPALAVATAGVVNAVADAFNAQWSEETGSLENDPANANATVDALVALRALLDPVIIRHEMQRIQIAVSDILFALAAHMPEIGPMFTSIITTDSACSVCTLVNGNRGSMATTEIRLAVDRKRGQFRPLEFEESLDVTLTRLGSGRCDACGSPLESARFLTAAPVLMMPQQRTTYEGWVSYPLEFYASDLVPGAKGYYRLSAVSHRVDHVEGQDFLIDFLHPDNGLWYRCNNHEVFAIDGGRPVVTGPSQNILMYELDLENEPITFRAPPRPYVPAPAVRSLIAPVGPVDLAAPTIDRGRRGFANIGNTCYLATALQLLTHSRRIRAEMAAVMTGPMVRRAEPVREAAVALAEAMQAQWGDHPDASTDRPIDLGRVFGALRAIDGRFVHGEQGDSDDAYLALVDALSTVIPGVNATTRTLVNTHLSCVMCQDSRVTTEEFRGLSLPINFERPSITLKDAIDSYFVGEMMEVDCGTTCHARTPTMMTPTVTHTAPVLMLSFKRRLFTGKLHIVVDYPHRLPVEHLIPGASAGSGFYRLIGVANHLGRDNAGHYVADFLHPDDGSWYRASDGHVVPRESPPTGNGDEVGLLYELE